MSRILPILFNQDMVRAILDGRKTVTRRIVKPQPKDVSLCQGILLDSTDVRENRDIGKVAFTDLDYRNTQYARLPFRKGDILYVRETFAKGCIEYGEESDGTAVPYISQCVGDIGFIPKEYALRNNIGIEDVVWTPSIHMPKEAARIWLKVTDVRVERLQNITPDDIWREGTPGIIPYDAFERLWDSTVKKTDRALYGWNANPWVWVIEFERCEKVDGVLAGVKEV